MNTEIASMLGTILVMFGIIANSNRNTKKYEELLAKQNAEMRELREILIENRGREKAVNEFLSLGVERLDKNDEKIAGVDNKVTEVEKDIIEIKQNVKNLNKEVFK